MSSDDSRSGSPIRTNAYVTAPYHTKGPGTLMFFTGGGRKYENVAFKHHMRLEPTFLAVDGMVMAQFGYNDTVECRVKSTDIDAMETSSE
jgi:hypothetical protein